MDRVSRIQTSDDSTQGLHDGESQNASDPNEEQGEDHSTPDQIPVKGVVEFLDSGSRKRSANRRDHLTVDAEDGVMKCQR